jgi:hypothetical protein
MKAPRLRPVEGGRKGAGSLREAFMHSAESIATSVTGRAFPLDVWTIGRIRR